MINDGDWIYFFGDEGSPAQTTTFAQERAYIFEGSRLLALKLVDQEIYYTLRPLSSSKPISASYDFGDMNVKGDGFRMYFRINSS
jgi:hypothetical protein